MLATDTSAAQLPESKQSYTREEVALHKKHDDCWIIIHGKVYNVTPWLKRHPGGAKVLLHYAGDDATVAFESFHNDKAYAQRYMVPFHIGYIVSEQAQLPEISRDFLKMRKTFEAEGLFKVKPLFFIAHFLHIIAMHWMAFFVLWYFGNTWVTWLTAVVLVTASQAQAGWLQHDFGHLTVFNSTRLNHIAHDVTIGLLKGVSSFWWNYRHFQHHAKPNVFMKDPDVTAAFLFLLGKWGQKHKGVMPYHLQHKYFFLIGPPLLLPVYFHIEVLAYTILKKKIKDLITMLIFYACFPHSLCTFDGRFLESHWFVWATQISHLAKDVDFDKERDWASLQLNGTRNVEQSFFKDWFLGHLNFQIEHHLFPTMPRHNFQLAQPRVIEFCKKHNLNYELMPLSDAFKDIISSLEQSGRIYKEAWDEASLHKMM
ncbi:hypothetical protein EMCRGX_G034592 [Ephydatia muelleri]